MYLVGVDSGGTHTNVRIKTADGDERSISEVDKSLSSTRSNAEFEGSARTDFSCDLWLHKWSPDMLVDQFGGLLSSVKESI